MYLVFFCVLYSCNKNEFYIEDFQIQTSKNNFESISFTSNIPLSQLKIYINKEQKYPILGDFKKVNNSIFFQPILPFTKGEKYLIYKENHQLSEFEIPKTELRNSPEILAIYPKTDTVPENLLKVYIQFSKPMQEVKNALNYIKVKNVETQKMVTVFLDIETELWNKKHTELTLWIDPGRIKQDLIPNKNLGKPLVNGNSYQIHISKEWRDANGNTLDKDYNKYLRVNPKDTLKPSIKKWSTSNPKVNTNDSLTIYFNENIDVMLVKHNVSVFNRDGNIINGRFIYGNTSNSISFKPFKKWVKGKYKILINTSLEDLAGNNFNRLFDTDISKKTTNLKVEFKELYFIIQ